MSADHVTIAGHVVERGSEAAHLLSFAVSARAAGASMLPLSRLGASLFASAGMDAATKAPGYIGPAPTEKR